MADRPPDPNPPGASDPRVHTPTWVKAFAVIAAVIVLLVALALVTGLGGPHGPQRHGASADWPDVLTAVGLLA